MGVVGGAMAKDSTSRSFHPGWFFHTDGFSDDLGNQPRKEPAIYKEPGGASRGFDRHGLDPRKYLGRCAFYGQHLCFSDRERCNHWPGCWILAPAAWPKKNGRASNVLSDGAPG